MMRVVDRLRVGLQRADRRSFVTLELVLGEDLSSTVAVGVNGRGEIVT